MRRELAFIAPIISVLVLVSLVSGVALGETTAPDTGDLYCEPVSIDGLPPDGAMLTMPTYGLVFSMTTSGLGIEDLERSIETGAIALGVFGADGAQIPGSLAVETWRDPRFFWAPVSPIAHDQTVTVVLEIDGSSLYVSSCGESPSGLDRRTWTVSVAYPPTLRAPDVTDLFVTSYQPDVRMLCCEDGTCVADAYRHTTSLEASVSLPETTGAWMSHQAIFFVENATWEVPSDRISGEPGDVLSWRATLSPYTRDERLCVAIMTRDRIVDREVYGQPTCITWDEVGPEPAPLDPVPEDFCEGQVVEPDVMEPVETDLDTLDADATSAPDDVAIVSSNGTDCACAVRGSDGPGRLPVVIALAMFALGLGASRRRHS